MKNRTSLTLLEMLIMILILALAAALCIRAFVYSGKLSKEDRVKAEALSMAQNAAELLKYYKGDVDEAFAQMGWSCINGNIAELDENWEDFVVSGKADGHRLTYTILVDMKEEDMLGTALISVLDSKTDEKICSIKTAWQEDKQ